MHIVKMLLMIFIGSAHTNLFTGFHKLTKNGDPPAGSRAKTSAAAWRRNPISPTLVMEMIFFTNRFNT